jgi:ribonuclease BN (tRNA processing enzyme)
MKDKIEIIFLGAGDAFGNGGFDQTCFLVNAPDMSFLIDCGCAVLTCLNRLNMKGDEIDAVILSHFHGDHFGGLPFFIYQQHFRGRKKPLHVYGPHGVQQRTQELERNLFPSKEGLKLNFPVNYVEYNSTEAVKINQNISFTTAPVEHVPEALPHAIRLQCHGKVIAYSGDTRWTEALVPVARHSDVFICEVYMLEQPTPNHLHYTALLENEQRLNSKRIILTHCSDDVLKNLSRVKHELAAHLGRIEI